MPYQTSNILILVFDETSTQVEYIILPLGFLEGKFISIGDVTVEVYDGIGHNPLNFKNTINSIGRGCISLGFRF